MIEMLSDDGQTCSVKFDGYGTTIIVRLSDVRPLTWENEDVVSRDNSKKFLTKPNAK